MTKLTESEFSEKVKLLVQTPGENLSLEEILERLKEFRYQSVLGKRYRSFRSQLKQSLGQE